MSSLIDLEPAVWSETHFGNCDLGDQRRTRRLVRYAQQMAEKPDASTPEQTESWSECKAVYRLFSRREVTFSAVTAGHYQDTCQLAPGKYLVISDTTEIDYGYKSPREGLGQLTAKHRRGFFLHSSLVADAQTHQVMGLGAQELWARKMGKKKRVHRVNRRKRETESDVWGRCMNAVRPTGEGAELIHVCDRGADNFDVFAHLHQKGDSWVIRAAQGRRIMRAADGTEQNLDDLLKSAAIVGSYRLWVLANGTQTARWATVEVSSTKATLLRPREGAAAFVMDLDLNAIDTNIVCVREPDPPAGCEPVNWILYTRERNSTFASCLKVIEYYEQRPLVEEYHKCLKTGLAVEDRQYETADRLKAVIGVTCVTAVRLLQIRDLAKQTPDMPAKKAVPREWVETLEQLKRRPGKITTVRDFLRTLASLGGFLGRKSDGEPGWQTLWRGLKTLLAATRVYRKSLK